MERLVVGYLTDRRMSGTWDDYKCELFTLSPTRASIVDLPHVQKLGRVRQLSLAHLVYPGV